jgi:Asp/Glu/hydantoin racemase
MRVLLINPNTSDDMTQRMVDEARRHCRAGTDVVGVTAAFGCAVIASRASYAIAAHAALDACAEHGTHADGAILACFGDPGLAGLRELAAFPVVGLAESAAAAAGVRGAPFAIVTAGPAWVPMLDEIMHAAPHAALYRGTHAIDATGLSVARDPERFTRAIEAAIERARRAGAASVILGGGALAGFGARLATDVTLIDPLEAAVADIERRLAQPAAPAGARLQPPAMASRGLSPRLEALLAHSWG